MLPEPLQIALSDEAARRQLLGRQPMMRAPAVRGRLVLAMRDMIGSAAPAADAGIVYGGFIASFCVVVRNGRLTLNSNSAS